MHCALLFGLVLLFDVPNVRCNTTDDDEVLEIGQEKGDQHDSKLEDDIEPNLTPVPGSGDGYSEEDEPDDERKEKNSTIQFSPHKIEYIIIISIGVMLIVRFYRQNITCY